MPATERFPRRTAFSEKLAVVKFDDEHRLRALARVDLYDTEDTATPVENPTVAQGMLEGSNVQPVIEMSRMIQVHQRLRRCQRRSVEKEDDRMKKMIRAISRKVQSLTTAPIKTSGRIRI